LKQLILASSSPYRRELLGRLGLDFESWSPDVDERPLEGEAPKVTAIRLARLKAEGGIARWPGAWVIGSDQVADHRGEPVGKPGTVERAREQLRAMRGRTVLFHTAVCLMGPQGPAAQRLVTTEVEFRAFGDAEIERYLRAEPALDCAGSAKSEGLGIALLARLGGDDPTALVGLPLIALAQMLRDAGFEVP
jgi:septum formation protein